MPDQKESFFFFLCHFSQNFLPILVVLFHPLSSTLYLFFPLLPFCQFWLFSFHPLFTCSLPIWFSVNFGCFSFIHFHPLFGGAAKGLELRTRKLDRRIIPVPLQYVMVCMCTFGQVLFWPSFRWWQNYYLPGSNSSFPYLFIFKFMT